MLERAKKLREEALKLENLENISDEIYESGTKLLGEEFVSRFSLLGREWILPARGHPQSAFGIPANLHRLLDIRLTGNKLRLEALRQFERLAFLLRRFGIGRRDVLGGEW